MANYAEKFSPKVAERFNKQSYTKGAASNAYEFEGVRIVKIYSEDSFEFTDYTRSGSNRYGTIHDQTDSLQELEMTQDKGVSVVIDKGEDKEKLNTQGANAQLSRQMNEKAIPMYDKYCFKKWTAGAGSVVSVNATPDKNTIADSVLDMTEELDNALVPDEGRTLWVKTSVYKALKQDDQWIYTDKLADKVLTNGQIGKFDNFRVVKVADKYFPAGVYAIGAHKSAILNPMKLKDYNIHKDPPGISGSQIDIRLMYDAFVLDAKAGAVCVLADSNKVCAAPTITPNTTAENIEIKGSFTKAWYTLDGSDPRCSGTAVEINANTNVNVNGKTVTDIRVVAFDNTKTVKYASKEAAYE